MDELRPFALVRVSWPDPKAAGVWARHEWIATTGHRERDGMDELFSIIIMRIHEADGTSRDDVARVFALVPTMDDHLPEVGERLIVTVGKGPLGVFTALDRGMASARLRHPATRT